MINVFRLMVTEVQNNGYEDYTGGDYSHDNVTKKKLILDEVYSSKNLVADQLSSFKSFKLRFTKRSEEPIFTGFNIPVEKVLKGGTTTLRITDEYNEDYHGDRSEWYHHFIEIVLKVYPLRDTIVEVEEEAK